MRNAKIFKGAFMKESNFIPYPEYKNLHAWEKYYAELIIEYHQCLDEGKDVSAYKNIFEAVQNMPEGRHKYEMADVIYKLVMDAPMAEGYKYSEPSDLEGIFASRNKISIEKKALSKEELYDKVKGAWVGRICGCLLGKPLEGITRADLLYLLKETGNYPLKRYIKRAEVTEKILSNSEYKYPGTAYIDIISSVPYDDDTNYTVMAQRIIEKYGRNFTSDNVADTWITSLPKNDYCTAERVAYLNLMKGFSVPYTAIYKNPYREWIGAQIRADYFGYINPFNVDAAAEMAWRDASISHIKNGIYGEMFVAAMLAAAYAYSDIKDVIKAGLSVIPSASRLYEKITKLIAYYDEGNSYQDFVNDFHTRYNERTGDWCHTISNAEIVVAALLYGEEDFGKTVCRAVEACLDTDCNGATAGSIIGLKNGFKSIPEEWHKPIQGKLDTTLYGVGTVLIEEVVAKTIEHIK